MKILIHSNGPMVPSGYGQQVRLLVPMLKNLGHDVAVSAFYGLSGSPITWEGTPILPSGQLEYGADMIANHARNHGADLVITLMDFWKLEQVAESLRDLKVLAWLPVDSEPLSKMDHRTLIRTGAMPLGMSEFGTLKLQEAGFNAQYAPHAVDRNVFHAPKDRKALRQELGLDEFFLVGICSANRDALRKGWPEQFEAFRRFHKRHPEARLMVHSVARSVSGFPLDQLADDMGIGHVTMFSDQYAQLAGLMDSSVMADWFGCLDVLSCCSYAEAFGVPILESQACGTPVIVTDGSSMHELSDNGWRVKGDDFWNPMHRAWWTRPRVEDIVKKYNLAFAEWNTPKAEKRRVNSEKFSELYDLPYAEITWKSVLEKAFADEVVPDEG